MENQIEQSVEQVAATQVGVSAQPATFKVKVFDLHTEDRFEYVVASMNDAINLYKQIVQVGRNTEPRPFVYLDDAQWLALIKFSGGVVRQVWVADSTGAVRGHNAGMRRREQAATNPIALPPALAPVAKPVAVAQPHVPVSIPEATPEQMATPEVAAATEKVPF